MNTRVTALDNGLRIASHEMPGLQTTSLGVWIRTGARNESESQNGIAHFLEHMAFKGSNRRSARQIAEEIENVGGDLDAFTSMETTAYQARVLKDDVPLALDIISDIILDPRFDEAELERERGVILQEIAEAADDPEDLVFDLLEQAAYPDQALGRSILGTPETVNGCDGAAIAAYRDRHYAAPSIVVSAAGAVEHERLVELVRSTFSVLPCACAPKWENAGYGGGVGLVEKPLEQTHVALGFQAVGYYDRDLHPLRVLSGILGEGMSSRLFQEVREKRGLCYSIGSGVSTFEDTGLFSVYAATTPGKTRELVDVISGQLRDVAASVSEDEVKRVKTQHKADLIMGLEGSYAWTGRLANQLLRHDRTISTEEIVGRVDAVDAASVSRVASDLFSGVRPSLGAVGNLSGLAPYDRIAAEFA